MLCYFSRHSKMMLKPSTHWFCFTFMDRNGSIVVNFTLVFLKGNQTVDQLLNILEIAVDNKTIHLLPVEKDTLRLILPSELWCYFVYFNVVIPNPILMWTL